MPTLRDVVALAKRESQIHADMVSQEFDVSMEKAYRILMIGWEKGLWVPFTTSFFVLGDEPQVYVRAKNSSPHHRLTRTRLLDLDDLNEIIDRNPETGVSLWDVEQSLGLAKPKLRELLNYLVREGELVSRVASGPGPWAYGQRPRIWGRTEEAVAARDRVYDRDKAEARSKRSVVQKEKKAQRKQKRAVTTPAVTDPITANSKTQSRTRVKGDRVLVDMDEEW